MSQKNINFKFLTKNEKDCIKYFKKESESLFKTYIIQKNIYKNKAKKANNNFYYKNFFFINIFLFEIILFILNKKVFALTTSNNYIEIHVADKGEQQIISDKYNLEIDYSLIYVNERVKILRNKKVSLDNENSNIRIEWDKTKSDFTHMFENINSITSITINNLLDSSFTNISYMFYNCPNLKTVNFIGNNKEVQIVDAIKMFYNCKKLESVFFNMSYEAYNINVSEMFYNCNNLTTVFFNLSMNINNMTKMFYNCNSLLSVDSLKFKFQDIYSIDMSYSFYNCENLNKFELKLDNINETSIISNNVRYMFYNCKNLASIDITNLQFENTIDMSFLFYNCQKLESITWNNDIYNLIDSNMENMFYNCSNITSVQL